MSFTAVNLTGHLLAGQFRMAALLGEGAGGAVYQACDELSGQEVAVKVCKTANAEMALRFERERSMSVRLDHPNIVRSLSEGWDPATDVRYIVMELLRGMTLKARLQSRTSLSIYESAAIGRQIASALSYAQSRHGLMHRDIKTENIFLSGEESPETRVKLMDFGIAKAVGARSRDDETRALWRLNFTQAGLLMGTLPYMAPESFEGRPSFASDVYALGIVLYLMVEGRYPFQKPLGAGPEYWLHAHTQLAPADLLRRVAPGYRDLVFAMLAKEERLRPGLSEVHARLSTVLAESDVLTEALRDDDPNIRWEAVTAVDRLMIAGADWLPFEREGLGEAALIERFRRGLNVFQGFPNLADTLYGRGSSGAFRALHADNKAALAAAARGHVDDPFASSQVRALSERILGDLDLYARQRALESPAQA